MVGSKMLVFGETSLDSLLLPLVVAGLCIGLVRMAVSACASAVRARDARIMRSAARAIATHNEDS